MQNVRSKLEQEIYARFSFMQNLTELLQSVNYYKCFLCRFLNSILTLFAGPSISSRHSFFHRFFLRGKELNNWRIVVDISGWT